MGGSSVHGLRSGQEPDGRASRPGTSRVHPDARSLLGLQRLAGNAAVVALLGSAPRSAPPGLLRPVQRCGPTPCDCPPEAQAEAAGLQRDDEQLPDAGTAPAGDATTAGTSEAGAQPGDEQAEMAISGTCSSDEEVLDAGGRGGVRLTGSIQRDTPDAGAGRVDGGARPVDGGAGAVDGGAGPVDAGPPAAAPCPVPANLAAFAQASVPPPAVALVRAGAQANGSALTTVLLRANLDPDRVGIPGRRAGQVTQMVGQCHTAFGRGRTGFSVSATSPCGGSPTSVRAGSDGECDTVVGAQMDALEEADNSRLLGHEQGHVRLACKVVDQANAALPHGAPAAAVAAAVSTANARINRLQGLYDNQSHHGCDPSAQQAWDGRISSGNFP